MIWYFWDLRVAENTKFTCSCAGLGKSCTVLEDRTWFLLVPRIL